MSIIEKALGRGVTRHNKDSVSDSSLSTQERQSKSRLPGGDDSSSTNKTAEGPPSIKAVSSLYGSSEDTAHDISKSVSRSGNTLKRSLNADIVLPLESLKEAGFLSPNAPRSRIAEEYRGIKRPLLRNMSGEGDFASDDANLVMVTSALQGDGKTFTSINLALSIAMEQDKTVLFVDADVVRATAGRTLGIRKSTPGLIDLLQENSELNPADVILRTNLEKLRVLPAGNASDNATELLASETMHNFMMELSSRYPDRVIVFDSPPLLLTTEASVLASFMGQLVFVASADITPQHAVQEALEQIGEEKMIGVVLNRASRRRSKLLGVGSYGYGYGYGHGYGYGREDNKQANNDEAG